MQLTNDMGTCQYAHHVRYKLLPPQDDLSMSSHSVLAALPGVPCQVPLTPRCNLSDTVGLRLHTKSTAYWLQEAT